MAGDALPLLKTKIPGPQSRALSRQLHRYESRNVTYLSNRWPIFWQRAAGANVWDVDGNRYLDLTAAFGVASIGHSNPRVVAAIQKQSRQLIHAMGDVHPNELKLRLAKELVDLTYGRWSGFVVRHGALAECRPRTQRHSADCVAHYKRDARVIFGSSGAEAVEIALKTAVIHTKRPGIIAFTGAYHGLTYGALDATHRRDFRRPFAKQLGHFVDHFPFGEIPKLRKQDYYGAVLVEPIQGRGGIVVPADDFLPGLREFCDRHGLLLILDEIYTGFCRTGRWFACEHWSVVPDIICVGKALAGGLPLAACIGRAPVMDSWPVSQGEAIHTSTFLGNPLGCAAGLAALAEMKQQQLADRALGLGVLCIEALSHFGTVRGRGLMLGLEVADAPRLCERLLQRGLLTLPEGEVLGITPPLTITPRQLEFALKTLRELRG